MAKLINKQRSFFMQGLRSVSATKLPLRPVAILALVYFVLARLGLAVHPVGGFATLLWAPSGLAIATLFLKGLRYWPGVALGAFFANYAVGATIPIALCISIGNTLEGVIAAYLLKRFDLQSTFVRVRDAANLFLCAAIASTMVSPSVGITSLSMGGLLPASAWMETWVFWWLGDMTSCLLIVPFFLTWQANPHIKLQRARLIETAALALGLIGLGWLTFFVEHTYDSLFSVFFPRVYLHLPFLLWAALRYGPRGAMTVNLCVVVLGMIATLFGYPPFSEADWVSRLALFEVFAACTTTLSLFAGALLAECMGMAYEFKKKDHIYQTIADSIDYGVWTYDHRCERITYLSTTFLQLIGYRQEEIAGLASWSRILHPEEATTVLANWQWCIRHGKRWDSEFRVRSSDGQWHPVLSRGGAVTNEQGEVICWAGILIDIARQRSTEAQLIKAKEAAMSASAAKSQFLADMSHEIRTPLAVILGYSDLLADSELSPAERSKLVEVVKKNGLHLSSLINDIIDLSRVEAGQVAIRRVAVDLQSLLREVQEVLHWAAQQKNIAFDVIITEPTPTFVLTDPLRLKQILMNVIGNAIKFTNQGQVVAHLQVRASALGCHSLHCEVSDTGPGISRDETSRLFRPFSQLDSPHARSGGGAGLGLVLSRKLAQLLGGDLRLTRSEPGCGSTFEITVDAGNLQGPYPLPLDPLATLPSLVQVRSLDPKLLHNKRILVVEDNTDLQTILCRQLVAYGMRVQSSSNGKLALDLIAKNVFDVILMDLQMPIMDGYEAARRIREQGWQVPVVALSAHAMKIEQQQCFGAGFAAFVAKPVDDRQLLEVLSELLLRAARPAG